MKSSKHSWRLSKRSPKAIGSAQLFCNLVRDSVRIEFSWAVEVRHPDWFDQGPNENALKQLLIRFQVNKVLFDSRPLFRASAQDALLVINQIARSGNELPELRQPGQFFFDVNQDRQSTVLDALLILNHIARNVRESEWIPAASPQIAAMPAGLNTTFEWELDDDWIGLLVQDQQRLS